MLNNGLVDLTQKLEPFQAGAQFLIGPFAFGNIRKHRNHVPRCALESLYFIRSLDFAVIIIELVRMPFSALGGQPAVYRWNFAFNQAREGFLNRLTDESR